MRYFIIVLLGIFLSFISCSDPDFVSRNVGRTSETTFNVDTTVENKGKHITSLGELRVLFIFSQFSNDTSSGSSWPSSTVELPHWTNKIINQSPIPKFESDNLTKYFFEMSRGNLMLYGDVYPKPVIPKYPQEKYKSVSEVNYEILSALDDEIDYSKYDHWSNGDNYRFIEAQDGKVDMIFIVYRNFENRLFFDKAWTGAAYLYLTEDIITNDGVKIATGRLDRGSGIQSRGGKSGFEYIKYVLAHEFGHFLFGAGHIENVTNLALMTGGPVWNASRGMHSWERNKIDWIDYIDIPNHGNSTIVTKDYITSGEAYRLKLTDDEWYVIENHQKLSSNDWAKDKGIYVYHIIRTKNFAPQITVKCADGNWDFELDTLNGKLIKTQPNPTGKSEIDILIPTQKTKYACFEQVYGDNSAWGDRFDAFDPYYNNVISPVSNPSNQNRAGQDFIIYVKEKENENFIVDIYFDDIYQSSPPSKPQINDISIDDKGALKLTWLKNNEPDLAGYVLYAYIINEGNPELIESKNLNKHITSISISENLLQKNQKNALALASFDITEKESLKSDFIELIYNNDSEKWDWKRKETY